VIVDMAASALGGNVAGSVPGETIVTENGVTLIGAPGLPATMPTASSSAYSRNITALLQQLTSEGNLAIDPRDEIQAGVVITHDGQVVHPGTAALIADTSIADTPAADA
jgi:NAD(P) transhydrogenase subunit alpha